MPKITSSGPLSFSSKSSVNTSEDDFRSAVSGRLIVSDSPNSVPPRANDSSSRIFPYERLGHVAAPANGSAFRESCRQLLGRQLSPFDGLAVQNVHEGRGVVDVADGLDRLAAEHAFLIGEPLASHVPRSMAFRIALDLANAILIAVAAFRPAGTRAQAKVMLIQDFSDCCAQCVDFYGCRFPSFRARYNHLATVFPGTSRCREAANHKGKRNDEQRNSKILFRDHGAPRLAPSRLHHRANGQAAL